MAKGLQNQPFRAFQTLSPYKFSHSLAKEGLTDSLGEMKFLCSSVRTLPLSLHQERTSSDSPKSIKVTGKELCFE